jgi:signal transduction histidine kinase
VLNFGTDFLILLAAIAVAALACLSVLLGREPGMRLKWMWLGGAYAALALHIGFGPGLGSSEPWHWSRWVSDASRFVYLLMLLEAARRSIPRLRAAGWAATAEGILLGACAVVWALSPSPQAVFLATTLPAALAYVLLGMRVWVPSVEEHRAWRDRRLLAILLQCFTLASLSASVPLWTHWGSAASAGTRAGVCEHLFHGVVAALIVIAAAHHYALRASARAGSRQRAGMLLVQMIAVLLLLLTAAIVGGALAQRTAQVVLSDLRVEAVRNNGAIARRISQGVRSLLDTADVIADAEAIRVFLEAIDPHDPSVVEPAAEVLNRHDRASGLDLMCVLDATGLVIGSSDPGDAARIIGHSAADRDFFAGAMSGNAWSTLGRALDRDTPVIAVAVPVFGGRGRPVGVVLAQQELSSIELEIRRISDTFVVHDDGFVLLSSRDDLRGLRLWNAAEPAPGRDPADAVPLAPPGNLLAAPPHDWAEAPWEGASRLVSRTYLSLSAWSVVSVTSLDAVRTARTEALAVTAAVAVGILISGLLLRFAQDASAAMLEHNEAEQALAAMETVVAAIAHDLRTPLSSIRALAELHTLTTPPLPPPVRRDLETIVRQTERMTGMVNRTLEGIREHHHDQDPARWGVVYLAAVLDAAAASIRPLLGGSAVTLEWHAPPELRMNGDAADLQRLVLNLLSNAQRHTAAGLICARAEALHKGAHDWLRLSVSDTGPGIPEEKVPLLGKPFALGGERAPMGAGQRGLGLGLTIVLNICEAHGGRLLVQTQRGVGTCFTAELRTDLTGPLPVRGLAPIEVESS